MKSQVFINRSRYVISLLIVVMFIGIAQPWQLIAGNNSQAGGLPALEARVAALEAEVEMLRTLLSHVRVESGVINGMNGPHLIIEGCNVHIRSGAGTTGDHPGPLTGLGNMVIGYNEESPYPCGRNGSHNLIVGVHHCFTNYGGLVAGLRNSISGYFSSVTGGSDNTASGDYSNVSGGSGNTASHISASVSGGHDNKASGQYASVTGGQSNEASGGYSSVSGGDGNMATGIWCSVSGGEENIAGEGPAASVSGGVANEATGRCSSVSAGTNNVASGEYSSVSGGSHNTAKLEDDERHAASTVSGGSHNIASGRNSTVSGGYANTGTGHNQHTP